MKSFILLSPPGGRPSFLLGLCAHCVVSSDTAVQVVLSVSFFLALHRKYLREVFVIWFIYCVSSLEPCIQHCLLFLSLYMKPTNFEKSFLLGLCAHCVVSSDTAVQVVLSVSFFLALHRKYLREVSWSFCNLPLSLHTGRASSTVSQISTEGD